MENALTDVKVQNLTSKTRRLEALGSLSALNVNGDRSFPTTTKQKVTTTTITINKQHVRASTNVSNRLEELSLDKSANQVLRELQILKLNIPGKSTEEAERALSEIRDSWAAHARDVEKYWLQTLDGAKRNKVIDIVRVNVRAVMRRLFSQSAPTPAAGPAGSAEESILTRLFSRVFNRMLWHGGQGLIDCFNSNSVDDWRVVLDDPAQMTASQLSTATTTTANAPSRCEVECCASVVDLCRQCLLVVYIAATEQQKLQLQLQQPSVAVIA